ncbi:hypothetical protein, partial [Priestia megaterium]|uniref:hypothetical protein n=1 Tax=Priestia megaterium TaxID=1404 RepID=UPI0031FCFF97
APPPPQVEEYGGYTDADAPPENTDEILPYEPFTSEPFPFEEEAPKPVEKKSKNKKVTIPNDDLDDLDNI